MDFSELPIWLKIIVIYGLYSFIFTCGMIAGYLQEYPKSRRTINHSFGKFALMGVLFGIPMLIMIILRRHTMTEKLNTLITGKD